MRKLSNYPLNNYVYPLSSQANNPFYRGYSAHEHTVLYSNLTSTALPQDIIIETLVSVLIVSIGLVLSAQKLKPISWREWAGEIERDGGARNPYMSVEERYGFWDIRVSPNLLGCMSCQNYIWNWICWRCAFIAGHQSFLWARNLGS